MKKYEIINESKHAYKRPQKDTEYTAILEVGTIIDVEYKIGNWLYLVDGTYVYSGERGQYAKEVE